MSNDVNGFWGGVYYYPDDLNISAVKFDAELTQSNSRVSGIVTEENTFDHFASKILCASLVGTIDGCSLQFEKTYTSGGTANHTILYEGSVSDDDTKISGIWFIGDWGGSFVMQRDKGRLVMSQNDNIEILVPV